MSVPSVSSVTLAIDTAGPRLQLALLAGTGEPDIRVEAIATGHAELIFLRINELLALRGLGYGDLSRLAVTCGPGSFTGLRIGLSAARGLALALSVPALGIPTLTAISLSAPEGAPVAVLVDARRNEAYFQRFAAPGRPDGPPALLPMAVARERVRAGDSLIETPFCDIGRLAGFAATADPALFPPDPLYVRGADAKPQEAARIARRAG
jgi:tRNA threonylcarbamoyladenosine biosynthesis protein TsaB